MFLIGLLAELVARRGDDQVLLPLGLGLAPLVAGIGLLSGRRWAWPLAMYVGAAGVAFGIYTMTQPGDITLPGAALVTFIFVVIPGAVVLFVLLMPRSLRWFRGAGTHR